MSNRKDPQICAPRGGRTLEGIFSILLCGRLRPVWIFTSYMDCHPMDHESVVEYRLRELWFVPSTSRTFCDNRSRVRAEKVNGLEEERTRDREGAGKILDGERATPVDRTRLGTAEFSSSSTTCPPQHNQFMVHGRKERPRWDLILRPVHRHRQMEGSCAFWPCSQELCHLDTTANIRNGNPGRAAGTDLTSLYLWSPRYSLSVLTPAILAFPNL